MAGDWGEWELEVFLSTIKKQDLLVVSAAVRAVTCEYRFRLPAICWTRSELDFL